MNWRGRRGAGQSVSLVGSAAEFQISLCAQSEIAGSRNAAKGCLNPNCRLAPVKSLGDLCDRRPATQEFDHHFVVGLSPLSSRPDRAFHRHPEGLAKAAGYQQAPKRCIGYALAGTQMGRDDLESTSGQSSQLPRSGSATRSLSLRSSSRKEYHGRTSQRCAQCLGQPFELPEMPDGHGAGFSQARSA